MSLTAWIIIAIVGIAGGGTLALVLSVWWVVSRPERESRKKARSSAHATD